MTGPRKRCTHCAADNPASTASCLACGRPFETGRDPHIGKVLLAKYRCLERIATGGTSFVYRVQHAKIGAFRALKLLRDEFKADPKAVEAFWREGRIAGALKHPNLVTLHDVDALTDATPCSIWELVEGTTLAERVRRAPLKAETAALVRGLCGALSALHERGIAHLDLCPENVLVGGGDDAMDARLIDLGEARMHGSPGERSIEPLRIGFSAPEQLRPGGTVDSRSDVFAMGGIICFAFSGQPPLQTRDIESYGEELRRLEPRSLKVLEPLPPPLRSIVESCLARDPAGRPANAAALRDEIRRAVREAGGTLGEGTRGFAMATPVSMPVAAAPGPAPVPAPVLATLGVAATVAPWTAHDPKTNPQLGSSAPGAGHGASATHVDRVETLPQIATFGPTPPTARLEPLAGIEGPPIHIGGSATLGRAETSTVRVEHPTVSKRHAQITHNGRHYVFEDTGSRNGSGVNGRKVSAAIALNDLDTIILGEVVFRFRTPG